MPRFEPLQFSLALADTGALWREFRPGLEWGIGLFVMSFVVSLSAIIIVLIRLPVDYFCGPAAPAFWPGAPPWLRWTARVMKNLIGAVLVAAGLVLSIPGVPGQGMLTILIGIMLLDWPAKRKLEKRIVARPAIFRNVNRLRSYFRRPPLVLEP